MLSVEELRQSETLVFALKGKNDPPPPLPTVADDRAHCGLDGGQQTEQMGGPACLP